jgi:hypothetical protein
MSNNASDSRQPFTLIPQTVYVGDRAALTLPYRGKPFPDSGGKDAVITLDAKDFPFAEDIEFHRIALERRASGGRLLVEFPHTGRVFWNCRPLRSAASIFPVSRLKSARFWDQAMTLPFFPFRRSHWRFPVPAFWCTGLWARSFLFYCFCF